VGEVYRARDDRLDRDVALKILPAGALTEDSQKRFRQEAVLLAKLNHPKIATIHEFSSHSSVDILVMELIPGRSLREILSYGPLPVYGCVTVQDLVPKTVQRHTHAVVLTDGRREIADKEQLLIRIPSSAKEANDAPLRVIAIQPFKAGGIGVPLQRGIPAV
jgi:hypothetical protein